jgi:23S rRNA pseudouridine2605 synthase
VSRDAEPTLEAPQAVHTSAKLLALNKPKGYLVTRSDDLGRKTVCELLPSWVYEGKGDRLLLAPKVLKRLYM